MAIKQELIDELLSDYRNPEDLLGEGGIFKELKKALLERALNAELSDHLTWRWASRLRATRRFWACGSNRPRGPSSGCG